MSGSRRRRGGGSSARRAVSRVLLDLTDDAQADFHLLAHADFYRGVGREEDVHARAELDHSDALAAHDSVAFAFVEDDAPRQESGDLFESDLAAAAIVDHDEVLLIVR